MVRNLWFTKVLRWALTRAGANTAKVTLSRSPPFSSPLLSRSRGREFQPEVQTVRGFDAGSFCCNPDRRAVGPILLAHSAAADCLEVDLAFRLFLSRVRGQHGILNLQVLRIRDDGSILETIDVKLQQDYKRLGFSFGPVDRGAGQLQRFVRPPTFALVGSENRNVEPTPSLLSAWTFPP